MKADAPSHLPHNALEDAHRLDPVKPKHNIHVFDVIFKHCDVVMSFQQAIHLLMRENVQQRIVV